MLYLFDILCADGGAGYRVYSEYPYGGLESGVEILFAVSAATTLAVEVAERCNLTLVGFWKPGRATVYTHPQRLIAG